MKKFCLPVAFAVVTVFGGCLETGSSSCDVTAQEPDCMDGYVCIEQQGEGICLRTCTGQSGDCPFNYECKSAGGSSDDMYCFEKSAEDTATDN